MLIAKQMDISCCFIERNASLALNYSTQIPCLSCGFSISRTPNLGIVPKTKRVNSFRLLQKNPKFQAINAVLRSESNNGLVVEQEFGFKPSFDEQLKVMESVMMKRKKRKDNSTRNDLSSSQLLKRDEKSVAVRKFGGSVKETLPSQLKQDGSVQKFSGIKFGDKEMVNNKNMDISKVGLSKGSMEKGYAKNGDSSVQVALRSKESETNLKAKRNGGENMKNDRWVKNQADSTKELEESILGRSETLRFSSEITNVVEKNILKVGGRLRHNENFRGASYSLERDKLNGRTCEIEKQGSKSSEVHKRYERNHADREKFTDQKFVLKNGYTNSSGTYVGKVDGKNFETERAAFKNFDVDDVMDKPRVTRMEMEERIQNLANWLNGADINIPEWMFSNMMRSAKIRFADHSIIRIIQILGKLGNWRRVLQVLEWLKMRERFQSHKLRNIYTAALDVLGKARRPVEALNVFHAMQQQMSSYPDLVAYHCIAVTLGQAGHVRELFDVIDFMRSPPKKKFERGIFEKWDPRLEPDVVVYNAVLNACVQRKQWEGAVWVLQQLKQQGQQPSCTTYGLVMEVTFACGKYNLVHEFFKKVQKSSIPNALTYKVLVNTLWREGKPDEAVLAVEDMERRGIVGSASLYYDLARCLCSVGRCHDALMQIEKICKVANKPLVVTYTGLIQACLESGNIHDGAYIFSQMRRFCCPNLVTYNIMLKGYVGHGMFEEAKQLFQNMSRDGNHIRSKSDYKERVIPDIHTFNTMLDACFADKRWEDFGFYYIQMLHHGYHFNAKRHLRMILDASRCGKGELLETTWKHLAQADQIQPLPLILERFCMKLERDDYSAAVSCVTSIPKSKAPTLSKMAWLKLFKENAPRFQKDTLVGLIQEVSILLGKSDLPDPIFQNLITSCREFFSIHMKVAEVNPTETVNTIPCRTALLS